MKAAAFSCFSVVGWICHLYCPYKYLQHTWRLWCHTYDLRNSVVNIIGPIFLSHFRVMWLWVTMQSHPISKWLKRPKAFHLEARCWPWILRRNLIRIVGQRLLTGQLRTLASTEELYRKIEKPLKERRNNKTIIWRWNLLETMYLV